MTTETVKATLRYVGTNFAGWQVQPHDRTVQGDIMAALAQIAGGPVKVTGASRTDSGVHALGQVCSFEWESGADLARLTRSLSRMLAPDIRFNRIEWAEPGFNARMSAHSKRYWYSLTTEREPDPFTVPFAWHTPSDLDLDRLAEICARVEGQHDFAGFESSRAGEKPSTVRTLHRVSVAPGGVFAPIDARGLYHIEFHGDGFLYKMVRNITGTLVDVARGRIGEARIDQLLRSPGPYIGHTAPGHGLTLVEVIYDVGSSNQSHSIQSPPSKRD